jgi:hypothetical protein
MSAPERGLTGSQGVMIPAANVRHLMLADRVVEAVEAGRFAVYPIDHIEEGLALLTGMTVGRRGMPTGAFRRARSTPGSRRGCAAFAEAQRRFAKPDEAGENRGAVMSTATSRHDCRHGDHHPHRHERLAGAGARAARLAAATGRGCAWSSPTAAT